MTLDKRPADNFGMAALGLLPAQIQTCSRRVRNELAGKMATEEIDRAKVLGTQFSHPYIRASVLLTLRAQQLQFRQIIESRF